VNLENQRAYNYSKSSRPLSGIFSKTHRCIDSDYKLSIASIIQSQIIPSLLKAERFSTSHSSLIYSSKIILNQKDINIFVDLCISQDPQISKAFIEYFLDIGLNKEDIFLELITPAARHLGSLWDEDHINFSQASIGFIRLHSIVNDIRFSQKDSLFFKDKINRVLIASAPGSLHMLGTTIVSEFFRKADWQVEVALSSTANELVQTVSNRWFNVIGLSISIEQQLTNLSDLIYQLKLSSLNKNITILLGGPIFSLKELRASEFGAGDICIDAKHAVGIAKSLITKD
jgi:methanogenic corrinoid protein MtbC1